VFYERQDADHGNYTYDHSSFIYVVDPDGKFAAAVASGSGSGQIADALSALIKARRSPQTAANDAGHPAC
jgi:cytochrome oxidase Cu insertion factor (SCO1/SenC/PrrC family)